MDKVTSSPPVARVTVPARRRLLVCGVIPARTPRPLPPLRLVRVDATVTVTRPVRGPEAA